MRDFPDVIDDLDRELAGRCKHKRAGAFVLGGDALDQRDSECERLARPRGRLRDHIAAGDRVADHGTLDGERLGDAGLSR